MSFTGNLFSKLRLGESGMASFISQYTSPPSRPVDEHDLAELSPRPEHALLATEIDDSNPSRSSSSTVRSGGKPVHLQSKGDAARMKASVAFQEPPWSPGRTGDAIHDYRAGKRAYKQREQNTKPPGISFTSEARDLHAENDGAQPSFFESMFLPRPAYTQRTPSTKVDQSFKLIERRERQMQQELQQLLDAQDYALEKHLANTTPDGESTPRSGTSVSDTANGHVVPVRQPKKRHLSKMEARLGISRCMSQLSDLKNEEEAYIATALGERKAALSRLRNLSTKRNSIVAEMKAIESDRDQPLKNDIRKMEHQHRTVCEDIQKLEERLRDLKRTKTKLETRIAEAKSTRDSELSGYRGALNECDKRIGDIMNYPEVSVLEVEGLMAQDADLRALVGQHISGFEFLSLRPERRTMPMAKDWWEGEVQVLELRKVAVDKERAALDEGTQLWQGMLGRLEEHDRHLKATFDAMSDYTSSSTAKQQQQQQQQSTKFDDLGEILKRQYAMCKEMTGELEELYEYTEAQGWKLLVTALGAEINYFHGLKAQLGDTLRFVGLAEEDDGVVTPPHGGGITTAARLSSRDNDLLGEDDVETTRPGGRDLEEEITGSVLRRWDGTDELLRRSISRTNTNPNDDLLDRREDSEDDNEVPPGLFSEEVPNETEDDDDHDDEHNTVPPEFLSMHSPSPKARRKGKEKMMMVAAAAEVEPEREPEGVLADGDEEGEEQRRPSSRASSANEVPPDLLAEKSS
ncbi:hypothetical protein FHL15_007587 [Xylaria flabelliformis]|uniref:Autophagy-related protein 28 n=1 Tax=Xylaria flabelliformis TaxID=2512241 RepID=A0A553HUE5_9PEZI|nr:hypothetical protein FHL15_007587 [Xylaria flabelliformis]